MSRHTNNNYGPQYPFEHTCGQNILLDDEDPCERAACNRKHHLIGHLENVNTSGAIRILVVQVEIAPTAVEEHFAQSGPHAILLAETNMHIRVGTRSWISI